MTCIFSELKLKCSINKKAFITADPPKNKLGESLFLDMKKIVLLEANSSIFSPFILSSL